MRFWPIFFVDFRRNPCSWVKNVGGRVSLECLGKIGKKNLVKNCKKLQEFRKNLQKFIKMRAFLAKITRN
jgi:hypothetical protein